MTDLEELAGGLWRTQLLHVAARLGIADRLAAGPRTAGELAREVGADADALFRVLRALAGLGVLSQSPDDAFGLTSLGERLRPDAPGSPHARLLLYGEPWWWSAVGGLYETVMTGETAFDRVHGAGLFAWLQEHPDASAAFDAEMTAMTAAEAEAVIAVAALPDTGTVVDVAGGRGTLLAAILRARPGLRGVLFDQPHVVAQARLPPRCEAVAGSFFAAVPAGADVYTLKDVLHDWDDERALAILRAIRPAIPDHGRLLVIERALPPGDEPAPGKLVDITMLLLTGGRERTRSEYAHLLSLSGFRLVSVAPASAATDVLTALPV